MDALLAEMPSGLLAEWEAFFALEPWGAHIENTRAALLASVIANVLRGERTRAYKLEDFLLRSKLETEIAAPQPDAAAQALKEWLNAHV